MSMRYALKDAARKVLPAPLLYRARLLNAMRKARLAARRGRAAERRSNPLPRPLLVSLTSFAPRFATLHLTLASLLDQNVVADSIVLWIAEDELALLPPAVRRLEQRGVTIRGCPDVRSYKKLVFAVRDYPDSYIATADDDLYFEPDWLAAMVAAVEPGAQIAHCHRAHRIRLGPDGRIAPYDSWEWDVQDEQARKPSADLFPTTGAGVLYPPGSFAPEVTDERLFSALCPTADDIWFFWMARRTGTLFRKVGPRFAMVGWPTRGATLWDTNQAGANDEQVRKIEAKFGNPLHF